MLPHLGQIDPEVSGAIADGSRIGVPPEGASQASEGLICIDDVQKALNRSRASVYRYTNTDPRNLNPPFSARKLNPEYRTDQKDALLFHPN